MAIHHPHARLFKRVFGAPAEAASFLQARLPASLSRSLHLLFDQTQMSPEQAAGSVRARLLQLTMMHAFNRAVREARARMRTLLADLEREGSGGEEDMKMFVRYILETGPEDTPEEMGEQLSRTAAGGELMTSGERLREEGRREGRLEGQRELKMSGERLRQEGRDEMRDEMRAVAEQRHREGRLEGQFEGRLEGQREGRLEAIDGFLRAGVGWSLIERATGIDEQEYRKLRSRPNGAAAAGGDGT